MLKIGIVGCGLQAATIAGYVGIYGDDYEVTSVMDINFESARARLAEKQVKLNVGCRFYGDLNEFVAKTFTLYARMIWIAEHCHCAHLNVNQRKLSS